MKIENLKISIEKKQPLEEMEELNLTEMGIEGDRHADGGDKQISIYSVEAIGEAMQEMQGLCYDSYDANLLMSGIDLKSLKIGDTLTIGSDGARIEITSHKGKCFHNCEKFTSGAYCTLRVTALYGKVVNPGKIKIWDEIKLEKRI